MLLKLQNFASSLQWLRFSSHWKLKVFLLLPNDAGWEILYFSLSVTSYFILYSWTKCIDYTECLILSVLDRNSIITNIKLILKYVNSPRALLNLALYYRFSDVLSSLSLAGGRGGRGRGGKGVPVGEYHNLQNILFRFRVVLFEDFTAPLACPTHYSETLFITIVPPVKRPAWNCTILYSFFIGRKTRASS